LDGVFLLSLIACAAEVPILDQRRSCNRGLRNTAQQSHSSQVAQYLFRDPCLVGSERYSEHDMLPRLRILQIGDLHLPTAARVNRNIDQKDRSFSVELRNIISSVPIKVVFRQIYKMITDGHCHAILFMGDLTDLGSLEN